MSAFEQSARWLGHFGRDVFRLGKMERLAEMAQFHEHLRVVLGEKDTSAVKRALFTFPTSLSRLVGTDDREATAEVRALIFSAQYRLKPEGRKRIDMAVLALDPRRGITLSDEQREYFLKNLRNDVAVFRKDRPFAAYVHYNNKRLGNMVPLTDADRARFTAEALNDEQVSLIARTKYRLSMLTMWGVPREIEIGKFLGDLHAAARHLVGTGKDAADIDRKEITGIVRTIVERTSNGYHATGVVQALADRAVRGGHVEDLKAAFDILSHAAASGFKFETPALNDMMTQLVQGHLAPDIDVTPAIAGLLKQYENPADMGQYTSKTIISYLSRPDSPAWNPGPGLTGAQNEAASPALYVLQTALGAYTGHLKTLTEPKDISTLLYGIEEILDAAERSPAMARNIPVKPLLALLNHTRQEKLAGYLEEDEREIGYMFDLADRNKMAVSDDYYDNPRPMAGVLFQGFRDRLRALNAPVPAAPVPIAEERPDARPA